MGQGEPARPEQAVPREGGEVDKLWPIISLSAWVTRGFDLNLIRECEPFSNSLGSHQLVL